MSKVASQVFDGSDHKADCPPRRRRSYHHHHSTHIISQVRHWLHDEKARRATRQHRIRDKAPEIVNASGSLTALVDNAHGHWSIHRKRHHRRTSSTSSDGSQALEKLEQILAQSMDLQKETSRDDKSVSYLPRRASRLLRKQSTVASSDTDYHEADILVPSADVTLDNSRICRYSSGGKASQTGLSELSQRAKKEKDAWMQFKYEIVRLSHTLKLTRWRKVPLDRSEDIEVERLSGALTNAVYVVSPPVDLPLLMPELCSSVSLANPTAGRPPP